MRILLTNDDGITAPGIEALYDALVDSKGEFGGLPLLKEGLGVTRSPRALVYPVAPLTVQSATSHGVTFHTPIMVRESESPTPAGNVLKGTAVDARPADCVKLAIANLWPDRFGSGDKPDVVISGMNGGANCGINTIYSGTVAAALEGAFLGVPSIAVSMMLGRGKPNFAIAARWARLVLNEIFKNGLPSPHECLSVNIPPADAPGLAANAPCPPIHVCPMNVHGLVDKYEQRKSPLGETYYWAAGHGLDFKGTDAGSDVEVLKKGCVTITPLTYDLTNGKGLEKWRSRVGAAG
jgi:5'-nucleotidase